MKTLLLAEEIGHLTWPDAITICVVGAAVVYFLFVEVVGDRVRFERDSNGLYKNDSMSIDTFRAICRSVTKAPGAIDQPQTGDTVGR